MTEKFNNRFSSKFILSCVIHKSSYSLFFPFSLEFVQSIFELNFLNDSSFQQEHKFRCISSEEPCIALYLIYVVIDLSLSVLSPSVPKSSCFRIVLTICYLTIMTINGIFVFGFKTLEPFHLLEFFFSPLFDPSLKIDISPYSEPDTSIKSVSFDIYFFKIISYSSFEHLLFHILCK